MASLRQSSERLPGGGLHCSPPPGQKEDEGWRKEDEELKKEQMKEDKELRKVWRKKDKELRKE